FVSRHSTFSSSVIKERMLSILCSDGRSGFWKGYCVCGEACGISTAAQSNRNIRPQIFTDCLRSSLHNLEILSNRWIGQFINSPAGPLDLDAVDFCGGADSENLARVV